MINCNRDELSWKWLTMTMHFSGLSSQLIDLEDERYATKKGKKPHRANAEEDGQMRLFPLTMEQRAEFIALAKNLRWFTKENVESKHVHDAAYWKAYNEIPYNGYEMYDFFERYTDEELKTHADMLEKVGNGEPLDDYMPLIKFLQRLSDHAHWKHNDARGGCF